MLKSHKSFGEIMALAAPISLLFAGTYIATIRQDNFSRDLQNMAGEGAIQCQTAQCEVEAFRRKQAFWSRQERKTELLMSCNTDGPRYWSEGTVYTTSGDYFQLTRDSPKGLSAAKISKKRWVKPYVLGGSDPAEPGGPPTLGVQIPSAVWRDSEVEVAD